MPDSRLDASTHRIRQIVELRERRASVAFWAAVMTCVFSLVSVLAGAAGFVSAVLAAGGGVVFGGPAYGFGVLFRVCQEGADRARADLIQCSRGRVRTGTSTEDLRRISER